MIFSHKAISSGINTFSTEDLSKALELAKSILALNESDDLGQYSVLVSMEDDRYCVNTMWTPYNDDSIVYCSESDLYRLLKGEDEE